MTSPRRWPWRGARGGPPACTTGARARSVAGGDRGGAVGEPGYSQAALYGAGRGGDLPDPDRARGLQEGACAAPDGQDGEETHAAERTVGAGNVSLALGQEGRHCRDLLRGPRGARGGSAGDRAGRPGQVPGAHRCRSRRPVLHGAADGRAPDDLRADRGGAGGGLPGRLLQRSGGRAHVHFQEDAGLACGRPVPRATHALEGSGDRHRVADDGGVDRAAGAGARDLHVLSRSGAQGGGGPEPGRDRDAPGALRVRRTGGEQEVPRRRRQPAPRDEGGAGGRAAADEGQIMKVILRNPRREVEVGGRRRVRELLKELEILPETVLVTRGDEMITADTVVGDEDVIELRPVISGGRA